MPDGPVLNLEFSRKSKKSRAGALTLVIDPKHRVPRIVVYLLSTQSDLSKAVEDLRRREGTSAHNIAVFLAGKMARRRSRFGVHRISCGRRSGKLYRRSRGSRGRGELLCANNLLAEWTCMNTTESLCVVTAP
jgi:hypothetical protein